MSTAVVTKGINCIQIAKDAYTILTEKRDAEVITAHLIALQEDGRSMIRSATDLKTELTAQEGALHAKLTQLQGEKKQFETHIGELNRETSKLETDLNRQEALFTANTSHLHQAQTEEMNAVAAYEDARRKYKKKKKKRKFLGGAVGFVVAGPVGAVAGAHVGGAMGDDGRVQRARSNLARCRAEVSSAQQAASTTKQAIASKRGEIAVYQGKIAENQTLSSSKHGEVGAVKKAIAFQQKSIHFWELFIQATNHAEDRTAHLGKLVDMAVEREDVRILKADGTITVARSFVEAWEAITANGRIQ